jgi:hypothetical protein
LELLPQLSKLFTSANENLDTLSAIWPPNVCDCKSIRQPGTLTRRQRVSLDLELTRVERSIETTNSAGAKAANLFLMSQ